jgi:hypothetical protein
MEAHVHALRAAFDVFHLERRPGNVQALKELMGTPLDRDDAGLPSQTRPAARDGTRGLRPRLDPAKRDESNGRKSPPIFQVARGGNIHSVPTPRRAGVLLGCASGLA